MDEFRTILMEAQDRMRAQQQAMTRPGNPPAVLKSQPQQPQQPQPPKVPQLTRGPPTRQPFEDFLDMYEDGKQIRKARGITDRTAPDWTRRRNA